MGNKEVFVVVDNEWFVPALEVLFDRSNDLVLISSRGYHLTPSTPAPILSAKCSPMIYIQSKLDVRHSTRAVA